jgi:C terminal of Calcineurin-like phosphoesterase/N terminal of Calcineurin-like phosphoesterase/Calcineurin-like phosphoesterase
MQSKFLLTRRHLVTGGAAAITLATATSSNAQVFPVDGRQRRQQMATGVVFEDLSGTGTRRMSDPGIAGVLVSNGRDVVRTDSEGRYRLPVCDETTVFVIKPTGYSVPIDPNGMLPRFYYIHQPNGTPAQAGLRARGIDPTGELPGAVDFALRKADEPDQFDVILLTDAHAESAAAIDYIRMDVVNGLMGTKAAFGMTLGDLMSDDLSLYDRYNRVIGQIGVPWYNIAGNHDLNLHASGRQYSSETFKRVFGPNYYAFEYGGALFLMLDNVDYLGGGKYRGRFGEQQLAFVSEVLRETPANRLVVAAMHIPLRSYLGPNDPAVNTSDGSELVEIIGDRPSISFSGHTHTTEHHYIGDENGITERGPHHHHVMTALSGSWWSGPYDHRGVAVADCPDGNPNGFHILSVDGNRFTTRFRSAKEPEGRQMRIVLVSADRALTEDQFEMGQLFGAPIHQDRVCMTDVIVNVFDGGPRTTVEYRIGEFGPVTMRNETRPDPFIRAVFTSNRATKKPWAEVEPCSHIWVAPLPADLQAGTQCIKVRAVDEYGREHHDRLCMEVTATSTTSTVRG